MSTLTIVANITAKPDKIEFVRAELEKLVPVSRNDPGCIQYDMHRDNNNPAHFMFYEIWESRELWQQHMNTPHLQKYMAATDGAIETFTLHEMSHVA